MSNEELRNKLYAYIDNVKDELIRESTGDFSVDARMGGLFSLVTGYMLEKYGPEAIWYQMERAMVTGRNAFMREVIAELVKHGKTEPEPASEIPPGL